MISSDFPYTPPPDRDSCACGCGKKARPGLQPPFATTECQQRWVARMAILDAPAEVVPALEVQDHEGAVQALVTFEQPVTPEQVVEVRDALADRTNALVLETEIAGLAQKPRWTRALERLLRRIA